MKTKIKAAKTEFTEAMLPHNRRQIFADVVKLHFWKLMWLGMIMFLFATPFSISVIVEDSLVLSILKQATDPTSAETVNKIASVHNLFALIQLPTVLLAFCGIAFALRVIRQLAWEENVDFGYDLKTGFKQNIKETALLGLVISVIYCLCRLGINQTYGVKDAISYIMYVPVGFSAIVIAPIALHTLVAIPIYGNGFWGKIKIGAFTFFRSAPQTLLATICVAVAFTPFLVPHIISHVVGALVTPVLFSFALLAFTLFAYNRLDKFVNPNSHPELIGRGITVIEED